MSVRFFYVDESFDNEKFCMTAIAIPHSRWKESFDEIKAYRMRLKEEHGIFLRTELHATNFVRGSGHIGNQVITKWQRSRIFLENLRLVARLPGVMLFNIGLPNKGISETQMQAWDRLTNRIERTMREMEDKEFPLRSRLAATVAETASTSKIAEQIETRLNAYRARAFIIADEGHEREITTALRKMHIFNPIPSQFGMWPSGKRTQNIPTSRIIEDPVFKHSHRSYFLQLADFAAFALLKREVPRTPLVKKYGIHEMFEEALSQICFKKASPRDPLGIVRA
jgi:hypothetical protein